MVDAEVNALGYAKRVGDGWVGSMRTPVVYSPDHVAHSADTGTWVGVTISSEEVSARIETILSTLRSAGREVVDAVAHDDEVLKAVHDADLIEYLRGAYAAWVAWGYPDDPGQSQVTAYAFPTQRFLSPHPLRLPVSPGALAGVYAMDTMTQIGEGTFDGARAAVDVAQTAADLIVAGAPSAYAACRPPGHHAGRGFFGGSCYLNNAAVAAQTLREGGFDRVAVIDIDAHHGNGTQQIFYERSDVVYGSVHVDPAAGWFPHFVGHSDETGSGDGIGANLNVPIEPGEGDVRWLGGIDTVVDFARSAGVGAVVVSLGLDAAISDPESPLQITEAGFARAGERVASLRLPTVFVQEGGYDLTTLGVLVQATLDGFDHERGADI